MERESSGNSNNVLGYEQKKKEKRKKKGKKNKDEQTKEMTITRNKAIALHPYPSPYPVFIPSYYHSVPSHLVLFCIFHQEIIPFTLQFPPIPSPTNHPSCAPIPIPIHTTLTAKPLLPRITCLPLPSCTLLQYGLENLGSAASIIVSALERFLGADIIAHERM